MLRYPKNLKGSDTIVFCLVYLPFDLNTLSSRDQEVIGIDGSTFEQDFKVTRNMDRWKTSNSVGPPLARGQALRSEGHSVFFRHMDRFTWHHVVWISVRTPLRKFLRKSWRMRKQCVPGPFSSPSKGLGTRLHPQPAEHSHFWIPGTWLSENILYWAYSTFDTLFLSLLFILGTSQIGAGGGGRAWVWG